MAARNQSGAFIREWLQSVGLKQADLVKKLDWSKAKANAVWHGEQRYNEDMLEEVAALVNARPRELLMHPEDAHAERALRATLQVLSRQAKEDQADQSQAPAAPVVKLPGRRGA